MRSPSTASGSSLVNSWIQPCMPTSWPSSTTRRCSSGWSSATTPGTKNDALMSCRLSRSRMRGTPTREPYSPWESCPGETRPWRSVDVSWSGSKERATQTRAPSFQRAGRRGRPARIFATPARQRGSSQAQAGVGVESWLLMAALSSDRLVAGDLHAAHQTPESARVVHGQVLGAAVVPESQGARRPAEAAGELGPVTLLEQEIEQRLALGLRHALEAHRVGGIHVEALAPALGMGAHDRVHVHGLAPALVVAGPGAASRVRA